MTVAYKKSDRSNMTTENVNLAEYQSLVGRLNWLTTKTRPDIRHATFRLQRRMNTPTTADAKALKIVYRYLKRSIPYGITLATDHTKGIEVFVDAAHADHEDGKSTEGYVIFYAGGPISWSSRKQSLVAPSSTVAEYCAFDSAAKEALYIKKLVEAFDLKASVDGRIPLYTDAANSLRILNHGGYTRSTRWLDNRYLFVADLITKNAITIQHIPGTTNPADGLTKPLDNESFKAFRHLLGMTPISSPNLHPGNTG
ncbi:hypothetical protein CBS147343_9645 [Aspergillus niger]|nr:hypothetical protein CBS147322_7316 [Aspergillus niger]KAI2977810.1 hypothetical protein CBS147344_11043 [Aspergillus niger]KAI3060261.1 hypothetical protein CBS147343_9645 [Aspergillus niger]